VVPVRTPLSGFAVLAALFALFALVAAPAAAAVRAGAAVVDSTAQLGYSAGQYASDGTSVGDHGVNPFTQSTRRAPSYGLESRETVRALVVEGPDGQGDTKRVAIVANDLYIPQDLLNRRIAQILAEHDAANPGQATGITEENLAIAVSHSHSSPYYSTPSWGVWAFQDVFDVRFFERHAQAQAQAVIQAAANLVPVRMGAAVSSFAEIHRHSYGPATADDGTPAGYPETDNDKTVIVLRFDDVSQPESPRPIAHWVVYGGHPEMLDGNDLLSGEYVHRMYRFVDRAVDPQGLGHVTLMTQQNVGTAEPARDARAQPPEARAEYSHREYAQMERAGRKLADAVLDTSADIENATPEFPAHFMPFSSDFVVDSVDLRFAPPSYRVFPSVSSCRSESTFDELDPGIPLAGLPDCEHIGVVPAVEDAVGGFPFDPGVTWGALETLGIIPDNTPAPSYTGLQESLQVHLQAIRLGEVGVTVCPCEQFADQSRNIKSRLDKIPYNSFDGFDWNEIAGFCTQNPDTTWTCRNTGNPSQTRPPVDDETFRHMQAQIHNDAAGWEEPSYAPYAESEPVDWTQIKGNYTREELTEHGYDIVAPISMANDYWGYIVTYREFQNRDHYRKALTGLGPHSSDFLATRLARMAASLKGGPPVERELKDLALDFDNQHQRTRAALLGNTAQTALPVYEAALPTDGGTPHIVVQPVDIERFDAAHVTWVGGSNYSDTPVVSVERLEGGSYVPYADQTGEVQMLVHYPQDDELDDVALGQHEWRWEATFEAYDSDVDLVDLQGRVGRQVPNGTYRFVIDGHHRAPNAGLPPTIGRNPYRLVSTPFQVGPWTGITVPDIRLEADGTVSFTIGPANSFFNGVQVGPVDYPDSYASPFPFIAGERENRTYGPGTADDEEFCFHCSFRPWADTGEVAAAMLTVEAADSSVARFPALPSSDGRWHTAVALGSGDRAFVAAGDVVDEFGETNGAPSAQVVAP
jgi:hypothetical protein